ncbi:MAG: hypothetical protein QNL26_06100 [Acidimicrobiia bacterium]|nr:hypothetical protein [Acidimicrobiia bacterium]
MSHETIYQSLFIQDNLPEEHISRLAISLEATLKHERTMSRVASTLVPKHAGMDHQSARRQDVAVSRDSCQVDGF